jgi:hypothetical protein
MTVMSALVKTASKVAVNCLLELSSAGVKVERRDQLGARAAAAQAAWSVHRPRRRLRRVPAALPSVSVGGGCAVSTAAEFAPGKVSRVHDDPDARLALMCRLYAGPAGDATTHLPYRRAASRS